MSTTYYFPRREIGCICISPDEDDNSVVVSAFVSNNNLYEESDGVVLGSVVIRVPKNRLHVALGMLVSDDEAITVACGRNGPYYCERVRGLDPNQQVISECFTELRTVSSVKEECKKTVDAP